MIYLMIILAVFFFTLCILRAGARPTPPVRECTYDRPILIDRQRNTGTNQVPSWSLSSDWLGIGR
jgi:hypothetical protein